MGTEAATILLMPEHVPAAEYRDFLLREVYPNATITIEPIADRHYRMVVDYDGDGRVDAHLTVRDRQIESEDLVQ